MAAYARVELHIRLDVFRSVLLQFNSIPFFAQSLRLNVFSRATSRVSFSFMFYFLFVVAAVLPDMGIKREKLWSFYDLRTVCKQCCNYCIVFCAALWRILSALFDVTTSCRWQRQRQSSPSSDGSKRIFHKNEEIPMASTNRKHTTNDEIAKMCGIMCGKYSTWENGNISAHTQTRDWQIRHNT